MYRVFEKLMKERGITPYRVSADTGIPQSTLSGWKTFCRMPQRRTLKKIADYFGVSVEYLKGETDEKKPGTLEGDGLTQAEWEIILRYRAASAEIKDAVQRVVGDGK